MDVQAFEQRLVQLEKSTSGFPVDYFAHAKGDGAPMQPSDLLDLMNGTVQRIAAVNHDEKALAKDSQRPLSEVKETENRRTKMDIAACVRTIRYQFGRYHQINS
ncbi:MAG: hypothetical protein WCT53_05475 [Candidatus Gracilibacteria bacterium]